MTKRIINRGTFVIELEACPGSSAGALYQMCQEKSMSSLPPETIISIKRGTATMKAARYKRMKLLISQLGQRITLIFDNDLMKKLRVRQAKLIEKSTKSVSFSSVVNELLRKGLKK